MTFDPHKNYRSDWETPLEWWLWAEATLGGTIDLDPCPNPNVLNWRAVDNVDVSNFEDGLACEWHGNVYCNPPGANSGESVKPWWAHHLKERAAGNLERLVWCFFNNEHTRHLDPSPWELPGYMVIPRVRVAFLKDGVRQKSPRNWTWFWTTERPARPPVDCFIVPTLDTYSLFS